MHFKKVNFIIFTTFFFIKINFVASLEIKILAQVNNSIITNEDVFKEKVILNYFNINASDQIALDNLVELNIKEFELKKQKISISEAEKENFVKIILKNNNKTLEDLVQKTNDKNYENVFKNRIKIQMSWNKFIAQKFTNLININMNEVSTILGQENNSSKTNNIIEMEKNKKLQSLSESYFNEIKNKSYIKLYEK